MEDKTIYDFQLMTKQEYRELDALNSSTLKTVYYNPVDLLESPEIKDSPHFDFGELVDRMLTTEFELFNRFKDSPGLLFEAFEDKGFVKRYPANIPSGLMQKFCIEYANLISKDIQHETALSIAYENTGFKRDSFEKVVDKFNDYTDYINMLLSDIPHIGLNTFEEAVLCARNFLYSIDSKDYVGSEVDQVKPVFTFEYEGVKCKAEIDAIKKEGDILTIIDYKTTGDVVYQFPKMVTRFGYHIQAGFYTLAVSLCMGIDIDNIRFIFLVGERSAKNEVIRFELDSEQLKLLVNGGVFRVSESPFPGIKRLISFYKDYTNEQNFRRRKDVNTISKLKLLM